MTDYKKLYEDANKRVATRFGSDVARELFPEFYESEDEKIRKWIIENIQETLDIDGFFEEKIPIAKKAIAWLEKQGEQKSNKIEPKFHKGDWVVKTTGTVVQIAEVADCQYTLTNTGFIPLSYEHLWHLWTIQDAKEGDVLCYKDEISLYKHDIKNCTKQETTFGGFVYHCCYDGKRFIMDSLYSITEQDKMDIHPATKEQRELLFSKMKEAGYEWDSEKKELNKIEQKSDELTNEEDEKIRKYLLDMEEKCPSDSVSFIGDIKKEDVIKWLTKQGEQSYWKPSEEQMQTLHAQLNEGSITYQEDVKVLSTLYGDLKKIATKTNDKNKNVEWSEDDKDIAKKAEEIAKKHMPFSGVPITECIDATLEMAEWKEKQMIEKACEWLKDMACYYHHWEWNGDTYEIDINVDTKEMIDDFKQAMEEE